MDGWQKLGELWQVGVALLTLFISVVASAHAVLYKRDSRSAISWVGFVWLVPLLGAVLYFTFGVNRIRRRAQLLRERAGRGPGAEPASLLPFHEEPPPFPPEQAHLATLVRVVGTVVQQPLRGGNRIEPLINGDAAYPAMLDAIGRARRTLALSTYIFDRDAAGLEFARALGAAVRRGVQVRVLIDATGTRYSWPPILGELRREKVPYARFLPTFPLWRLVSMNLRNHRKFLVADGTEGFTGGMNIRIGHWLARRPASPVQDVHFRLQGPVVRQLLDVFAEDWQFTTGEVLEGEGWFPALAPAGAVLARGIPDGPDEDLDKLRWTLLAALAVARRKVRIVTPYFLPDPPLVSALNLAALRGVKIEILLPAKNSLIFVHWASRALWWQVLEHGCSLWLTPPPFDHSKLVLVDDAWALLGSANWDPRSLRLNFEFNVECYDDALVAQLDALIESKRRKATPVTLAEMDARIFPVRLRDGVARLLTPYL